MTPIHLILLKHTINIAAVTRQFSVFTIKSNDCIVSKHHFNQYFLTELLEVMLTKGVWWAKCVDQDQADGDRVILIPDVNNRSQKIC